VKEILDDLSQNSAKISEHGKRVDDIIRSMVSLSQGRTGEQQLTNIHALLSDVLNLAYHGKQSKDSKFQVHIVKNYDQSIPPMLVFSVDLNRAFLNIINMLITL
jgi:nitrogen-specific signal transduction histidine kinase